MEAVGVNGIVDGDDRHQTSAAAGEVDIHTAARHGTATTIERLLQSQLLTDHQPRRRGVDLAVTRLTISRGGAGSTRR